MMFQYLSQLTQNVFIVKSNLHRIYLYHVIFDIDDGLNIFLKSALYVNNNANKLSHL